MPMYDKKCSGCGTIHTDIYEPINTPPIQCACGGRLERVWLQGPPSVIGDEIPGGIWIKHGLVHDDGSPMQFFSKSDIAKEAKRRGLVNWVEHAPPKGHDRSKHTTRWI